jgi:hypothetical protein
VSLPLHRTFRGANAAATTTDTTPRNSDVHSAGPTLTRSWTLLGLPRTQGAPSEAGAAVSVAGSPRLSKRALAAAIRECVAAAGVEAAALPACARAAIVF